jgi:uncharacterized protein (TIGR02246 family)
MAAKTFQKLMCLAVLVLGVQTLHAHSEDTKMQNAQIQSAIDTNNAAVAARDIDAILETYEPNAAMAVQPGMAITGSQALRDGFKQFLALDPKLTITNEEIIQTGDIALHSYTWDMTGKAPDGSSISQSGLSVVVLRKQADGRWLMVIDNPFGGHLLQKK